MSGARVFLDEDTQNRLLVEALEAKFVDVLTANDADLAKKRVSDEAVLSFASSEERVVVTHNCSDFRALHEASSDHAGIVLVYRDPFARFRNMSSVEIADAIVTIHEYESWDMKGKLRVAQDYKNLRRP